MSDIHQNELGGAIGPAIEGVIRQGISAVSVADAGSKASFLDAWIKKFKSHCVSLRLKKQMLEAPSVVIFVDDCLKFTGNSSWQTRPMLGTSPETESYAGRCYVGTAEVGGYVNCSKLNSPDDFTDLIYEQGLQSCLIVMLCDLDSIRIWPDGFDNGCDEISVGIQPNALTQTMIDEDLSIYYEQEARQCVKWWKVAKERITVENPERVVQDSLRLFLIGRYADIAKVREEVISGNGRADITIVGLCSYSAVLELKTTRESRTPKREGRSIKKMSEKLNIRWAVSGVKQAAAYRQKEGFSGAFLCVYDFTKSYRVNIEMAIQQAAAKYSVDARLYWITASHEEHRDDRFPVATD